MKNLLVSLVAFLCLGLPAKAEVGPSAAPKCGLIYSTGNSRYTKDSPHVRDALCVENDPIAELIAQDELESIEAGAARGAGEAADELLKWERAEKAKKSQFFLLQTNCVLTKVSYENLPAFCKTPRARVLIVEDLTRQLREVGKFQFGSRETLRTITVRRAADIARTKHSAGPASSDVRQPADTDSSLKAE